MSWALIATSDNRWLSGPLDEEPTPADGECVIQVALGYPDTCMWSQATGGFVDHEGLEDMRGRLLASLDDQAEATRLKYITNGSGQSMTYQYKVAEAAAWTADNEASVPFLSAEADARGMTIADLVSEVQTNAAAWTLIGSKIEAARMGAKTAVRNASTAAEMIAAATVDWQAVTA